MAEKGPQKPQMTTIMEQARILFWEKGYTETSMKDIAEACGFRPANIYNFFANKEGILYEILLDEMNEVIGPITHIEHDGVDDPVEQLRFIIKNHVALTLGIRRSSKLLFDIGLGNLSKANRKKIIKLRDDYDRITRTVIERGIDKGAFRPVDVPMTVFCIASMITRTRLWYKPSGRLSVDEIIEFISNFALRGLLKN